MHIKPVVITSHFLSSSLLIWAGFSFISNAQAAGLWEGDSGPFWQTAGNWDDGNVPDATVDVIINGAGTDDPIVDSLGPGENARNVVVGNSGGAGSLTIVDTASLTVHEDLIISALNGNNAGEVFVTDDTALLIINGALTINDSGNNTSLLNIENGADVVVNGTTIVGQGAIIEFSGTGNSTLQGNGGLIVDGSLLFDHTNGGITIDKDISGAGLINISSNSGTTTLTGNNSGFTGTFRVVSGELNTSSANAFGGVNGSASLVMDGGTLFNGVSTRFSSLSGSGGVIDLALGSTLQINQNTDTTFSGIFESSGDFIKSGTGILILNGANTHSGGTTVAGGSLLINGSINDVTVNSGTLGGSGNLGNITINSGGTLAPGNSIGTTNVSSTTFNTGSIYEVELDNGGFVAGTNNDLLNTTGTVTINGGTVNVTPENGTDVGSNYTPGTYTVITADSGITGTFDTLTDDYAFLDFALAYDATNVFLNSSIATGSFCLSGMSDNQCATGNAAYSLGMGNSLFSAVLNLSEAEASGALDQLSGEIHASTKTLLMEDSRFIRESTLNRLVRVVGESSSAFWIDGIGSWGHWDGDHNAAKFSRDTEGMLLGGDMNLSGSIRLGAFAGYTQSDFDIKARSSDGEAESWHLGVYGGAKWNAWKARIGGGWSENNIDTSRDVVFSGFSESLSADYDARTLQAFGEAGYTIKYNSFDLEPFARLAHVHLKTDGYTETAGEASLNAGSQNMDTTFAMLGLRTNTEVDWGETTTQINGSVGWRKAFGDYKSKTSHRFDNSDEFSIDGTHIIKNALVFDLGASMLLSQNSSLGLSYSGELSSDHFDQGLKINFIARF